MKLSEIATHSAIVSPLSIKPPLKLSLGVHALLRTRLLHATLCTKIEIYSYPAKCFVYAITLTYYMKHQQCSVKVSEKMHEIILRKRALQEIVTFKEQQIQGTLEAIKCNFVFTCEPNFQVRPAYLTEDHSGNSEHF